MKRETNKDKTTMTAREVAVLIEDLRSQFGVFGEGQKLLSQRVDKLEYVLEKLSGVAEKIDLRLIKMEKDVAKIEQDIHVIKEEFGKRVSLVEAKVASLNHR